MEQSSTNLSSGRKRKFWLFLLLDVIVGLGIMAMMLILLSHSPAGYNPPSLLEAPKEVNPYFTHTLMPAFYNGIESGKPFTLLIEEKPLNEAILACGWPQAYEGMIFSTPVVFFTKGRVTGICRVNSNSINTVITVAVEPRFDKAGKLNLSLKQVKAGAVGLTLLIKPIATRMYNSHMELMNGEEDLYSTILGSILANKPFNPVIDLGKKKARVTGVKIEKGAARIELVPVK